MPALSSHLPNPFDIQPILKTSVALLLFAAGCSPFDPFGSLNDDPLDVGDALIRTSSETYTAERTGSALEVAIPLTLHNETGQTVYINRCRSPQPPVLQKHMGGEWKTAYSPGMYECLGPPVVKEAGEEYETTRSK